MRFYRLVLPIILFLIFFHFSLPYARAVNLAKDYTLPYPPIMPGNTLYKIRLIEETLSQWWSFGSFGQFQHHLSLSDKYLVQTKTLLEYDQYLLASQSLTTSSYHFQKAEKAISRAQTEKKTLQK